MPYGEAFEPQKMPFGEIVDIEKIFEYIQRRAQNDGDGQPLEASRLNLIPVADKQSRADYKIKRVRNKEQRDIRGFGYKFVNVRVNELGGSAVFGYGGYVEKPAEGKTGNYYEYGQNVLRYIRTAFLIIKSGKGQ